MSPSEGTYDPLQGQRGMYAMSQPSRQQQSEFDGFADNGEYQI